MDRLTMHGTKFGVPISLDVCANVACSGMCADCKIHELIARLCEYEDTELTPEEIKALKSLQWIYRTIDALPSEFEQTIGEVERALGFRLFVWQRTYIVHGQFRQMGATTAEILRDLLDVSGKPIDYSRRAESEREHFYRWELYRIKEKLDNAGIPTRTVLFSERDKRAYKRKEGET